MRLVRWPGVSATVALPEGRRTAPRPRPVQTCIRRSAGSWTPPPYSRSLIFRVCSRCVVITPPWDGVNGATDCPAQLASTDPLPLPHQTNVGDRSVHELRSGCSRCPIWAFTMERCADVIAAWRSSRFTAPVKTSPAGPTRRDDQRGSCRALQADAVSRSAAGGTWFSRSIRTRHTMSRGGRSARPATG